MSIPNSYTDIILEIKGKIGIIQFNRPKSLNAFGGNLIPDTIAAFRELDKHPDTVFTVLTGKGRFFSSGADIKGKFSSKTEALASCNLANGWGDTDDSRHNLGLFNNSAEKKVAYMQRFAAGHELMRTMIDHRKVFVLALNGPAVGGGAAWFQGIADIVFAARDAYLHVSFSALGLVPEGGSTSIFAESIGVRRANECLIFGRKMSVEELERWGLVNRVFQKEAFLEDVVRFLEAKLEVNDGGSMMEAKRLMNWPLRERRIMAVYNSTQALADRFVEGAPMQRFAEKRNELEAKSKNGSRL